MCGWITPAMSIEDIRKLRNAAPFQPFVIHMSDGRTIPVTAKARVGIAPWGKIGVFEGSRFHLLPPAEIAEVRPGSVPIP